MPSPTVAAPVLMTAEVFALRPDPGHPEELVRGQVVTIPPPKPRHGYLCNKAGRLLGNFCDEHRLGWVFNNDTGVVTERDPDTVRGADVAFYGFGRLPDGPLPDTYPAVAPDLVVEVLSPSDRWPRVLVKVGEYLDAGTRLVLVLDDDERRAHLFGPRGVQVFGADDALTFPDVLPGLVVVVRRFFE
ncbi:MAG: Uma2 family endonuclease [Isosphaeraceae bacterium]